MGSTKAMSRKWSIVEPLNADAFSEEKLGLF